MSTAFPSALDTSTTLYDLVNNAQAALSAGYTAGGTTLDLDSAALFPATGGIIYVGNERTTYTGKTSNQLTGVTALSNNYPSSTAVVMYLDAEHVEVLRDAIIAVETRVGVTGSTVAGTLTKRIADLEGAGGETITISAKTGAYTVVAGDLGTIINCTANSFTVSLTAAVTLGAGFNCWVWNTSNTATDVITVDPNGAETIDGMATLILRRGEGMQIVCDGTNWQTGDKKTMRMYAENFDNTTARPIATGALSMALGHTATASAQDAYALGRSATASGQSGVAIGTNATASSTSATAIGGNSSSQGSQAVTGAGAMALGGSYASGTDSFAAGIGNNTSSYGATANTTVALGPSAKASAANAIAIGNTCVASGAQSVAIGGNCSATQTASIALGNAAVSDVYGKQAISAYSGFGVAAVQSGTTMVARGTTDATATVLTANNSAAGTTNQVILPNNTAYAFDGLVVSRQQAADGTASAAWKVEGLIRREANAGTTTLVASTVTAISNVPGWTLALSADTTNGGLTITFTGAAATDIRTFASIRTAEVTYA